MPDRRERQKHANRNVQFLADLPHNTLFKRLALFLFPSGEFPHVAKHAPGETLRDEQSLTAPDQTCGHLIVRQTAALPSCRNLALKVVLVGSGVVAQRRNGAIGIGGRADGRPPVPSAPG